MWTSCFHRDRDYLADAATRASLFIWFERDLANMTESKIAARAFAEGGIKILATIRAGYEPDTQLADHDHVQRSGAATLAELDRSLTRWASICTGFNGQTAIGAMAWKKNITIWTYLGTSQNFETAYRTLDIDLAPASWANLIIFGDRLVTPTAEQLAAITAESITGKQLRFTGGAG